MRFFLLVFPFGIGTVTGAAISVSFKNSDAVRALFERDVTPSITHFFDLFSTTTPDFRRSRRDCVFRT